MTISELIKELETYKNVMGDVEVKIQYGDAGGYYPGQGDIMNIDFDEEEKKIIIYPE